MDQMISQIHAGILEFKGLNEKLGAEPAINENQMHPPSTLLLYKASAAVETVNTESKIHSAIPNKAKYAKRRRQKVSDSIYFTR
jgi:hypothetical protein